MMRAACLRDRFPPSVIHPTWFRLRITQARFEGDESVGQCEPYASSEAVRAFTLKFEPKIAAKPPRRLGILTTWSEKPAGAHV